MLWTEEKSPFADVDEKHFPVLFLESFREKVWDETVFAAC